MNDMDPGDCTDEQLELHIPQQCPCQAATPAACPYAQLWGDKPEGRRPKQCLRRLRSALPEAF